MTHTNCQVKLFMHACVRLHLRVHEKRCKYVQGIFVHHL